MTIRKTSAVTIEPVAVPLTRDSQGTLRVKDSRLSLDSVLAAWRAGESPEGIVACFDSQLTLAEVHALLAFYYSHQAEVDAYLDEQRAATEEAWQQRKQRVPSSSLHARLLAEREHKEAAGDLAPPP